MRIFMALPAVAAFTAILAAGPLPAQTADFGFGAYVGGSLPLSDYGDDDPDSQTAGAANIGFSAGVDLYYPLTATGQLTLLTSVGLSAHGVDEEGFGLTGGQVGGYLLVPIVAGVRYDVPLGVRSVFVTGQVGVTPARAPSLEFAGQSAESDWATPFTWAGGGGFQATRNLHFGARYVSLGDVNWEYEPATLFGGSGSFTQSVSFLDLYVGFGVR